MRGMSSMGEVVMRPRRTAMASPVERVPSWMAVPTPTRESEVSRMGEGSL